MLVGPDKTKTKNNQINTEDLRKFKKDTDY